MINRFIPRISGEESLILALVCLIITAIFIPWSLEFDLFALFGLAFLLIGAILILKNHTRTSENRDKTK